MISVFIRRDLTNHKTNTCIHNTAKQTFILSKTNFMAFTMSSSFYNKNKINCVNYDFIMKRIHYPAGWLVKLFYIIKFIQLSPLWFQIKNPKPKTKLLSINYWKKFHWSLLMRFKTSNIFPLPQRRPLFLPAPGWLARSALPAVAVWCHLQWCSKILEGLAKASLLEL